MTRFNPFHNFSWEEAGEPVKWKDIISAFTKKLNKMVESTFDDKWGIDYTAGRPILVYDHCSVIEGDQAEYLMNFIHKDVYSKLSKEVK